MIYKRSKYNHLKNKMKINNWYYSRLSKISLDVRESQINVRRSEKVIVWFERDKIRSYRN